MAENIYSAYNGHIPTSGATAAIIPVTTGATVKTLMQLAPPSGRNINIVEWGISFDGSPAAIRTELIDTGTVFATVTAYTSAAVDITNVTNPGQQASQLTIGTGASGFTASAEGTITSTQLYDYQVLSTNTYIKQWPLGREPMIKAGDALRIRVTAASAVNAICYITWRE